MDFDSFLLAVSASIASHLVVLVVGAIGMGLLSWLFHTKKMQALRDDIEDLKSKTEDLKSKSGSPVISNVIQNIVPESGYRVDSKNAFVEFGTVRGKLRVRLGDPQDTSKDIAQWLHNKRMIAALNEAERLS